MCSGFFRNLQKVGVEVNKKRVKATSLFNEAAKRYLQVIHQVSEKKIFAAIELQENQSESNQIIVHDE